MPKITITKVISEVYNMEASTNPTALTQCPHCGKSNGVRMAAVHKAKYANPAYDVSVKVTSLYLNVVLPSQAIYSDVTSSPVPIINSLIEKAPTIIEMHAPCCDKWFVYITNDHDTDAQNFTSISRDHDK